MLSEDRVKGSFGIGIGLLMSIVLTSFLYPRISPAVYWMLLIPSTAVFVSGCAFYSKSKGYSPLLGVLGFAWVFGLVPLILLPDRKDTFMKELSEELEKRRAARNTEKGKENANVS